MPSKPKLPQSKQPSQRDMFQTPAYATELLIPFIPKTVNNVWECAVGGGKIEDILRQHSFNVIATDLFHEKEWKRMDFLTGILSFPFDAIITNPPYSSKKEFFLRAMDYGIPVAMLIPADYSGWIINCIRYFGCEKIIPTRRIDYITPTGKSGTTSSSMFHSMWLTYKFGLGKTETFVELTKEDKMRI